MEMAPDSAKGLEVAEEKVNIKGITNIAVIGNRGNLVVFERMGNVWLANKNIAMNKVLTAVAFNMTTENLRKKYQPEKSLFGVYSTNDCRLDYQNKLCRGDTE